MHQNDDIGQDCEDIDVQQLIKCVTRWHPSHKQYSRIQLIKLEFKALRQAIINKSKHGEWDSLRRRLGYTEDQCFNLLQQSQGFLSELDKTLMTTQRECGKRMERIQMDSLHRDIQIRSMLDEQILKMVEENKALELSEEEIKPFVDAYTSIDEKIKLERKNEQELMLKCRIELEEFKFQNSRKFREIKKKHETQMQFLKEKLKEIQTTYTAKIQKLRQKREAFEKYLLDHIQNKIKNN